MDEYVVGWVARCLIAASIVVATGRTAQADSLCYLGDASLQELQLNGDAHLVDTGLQITSGLKFRQLSSAFFKPQFATTGDLHAEVEVRIDGTADGMALVISADPRGPLALGAAGTFLGYGPGGGGDAMRPKITPSVIVELDYFVSNSDSEASPPITSPHIAIMRNGDSRNHLAVYHPPFAMNLGTPFRVWMDYVASSKTLDVYVSQSATKPAAPQLTYHIDLATDVGPKVWLGMTGASGALTSDQRILSFRVSDNGSDASEACCESDAECAGSVYGAVCDTMKHVCGECTAQTTAADCAAGQACDTGVANNVCVAACDGNFNSGAAAACAHQSAPYCVTSGALAGTCAACDSDYGAGGAYACPAGAPLCNPGTDSCEICLSNAQCAGQVCDTERGACAACTSTTQCADQVCDTRTGMCAACDGDFGTAAASACAPGAPYCVGGSCETTRCAADAECGAGQWCDGLGGAGTATCEPKTATGIRVPGGACDATLGARACVSGACDPADDVCGLGLGQGGCASDSECHDGICIATGPNAGKCEECASASDCSGATPLCDPASNTCVACASSSDCSGATPVCTLSTHTCVACAGDNGTGNAQACATSSAPYCTATGGCGKCAQNSDCAGGGHAGAICNVATGACGDTCASDSDCAAGQWCEDVPGGSQTCQPEVPNGEGVPGGTCDATLGARACISGACDTGSDKCGIPLGQPGCAADAHCLSGVCIASGVNAGTCQPCRADSGCSGATPACDTDTNSCVQCTEDSQCSGGTPVCDLPSHTCVACAGDNGSGAAHACPSSTDPYCAPTGECATCTDNSECAAGTHSGPICNPASGACGSKCTSDSDCAPGEWCDDPAGAPGAGQCSPKLSNGQPLPSQAPVNGACTSDSGARVCASGVCDPTGNVCGLAQGQPGCSDSAQCIAGVCITAGANAGKCEACAASTDCSGATPVCDTATNACVQCGSSSDCSGTTPVCDAGAAACVACGGDYGTAAAAACADVSAPTCMSTGACGVCSTNADCEGDHAGPICNASSGACGTACASDADCSADRWCQTKTGDTAGVCAPKLDNGTALPSGACTDAAGAEMCASGACDSGDDLCGRALGGSCTTNAECRDDHCADDGQCGTPDGAACVSSTECRAGRCSDGICRVEAHLSGGGGFGSCSVGATPGGGTRTDTPLWALGLVLGFAVWTRRRRRRAR